MSNGTTALAAQREPEPQFAAFIGIDWADQTSAWCLQAAGSNQRQSGEVSNQPDAIEQWAADLSRRFSGRPVAVAIEQSRGRVVYQLAKFSHLVVFIVDPIRASNFRATLYPSGAKRDPTDASLLLDLLVQFRHLLHRLAPDTQETRLLQMLVEERRKLVDDKTAYSNRLTNALKLYFPQMLEWVDDIDSQLGCDWIERWSTLESLQRCHPGTLKKMFIEHNCRSQQRIRTRIEEIQQAVPAIHDSALMEGCSSVARHCAAIINQLRKAIQELDQQIEQLVAEHPDTYLFQGLPGVGEALLPRLIVAFGTRPDRYSNVNEFLAYSGIAPVTVQSGKTRVVHWRYCCPKFLRQTFQEWAAHSIRRCGWARQYYDLQRSRGKKHFAAVRALAYKWIRILFRCWLARTPYDEKIYLRSLTRRNSPLATSTAWQTVSGFSKLVAKNT